MEEHEDLAEVWKVVSSPWAHPAVNWSEAPYSTYKELTNYDIYQLVFLSICQFIAKNTTKFDMRWPLFLHKLADCRLIKIKFWGKRPGIPRYVPGI